MATTAKNIFSTLSAPAQRALQAKGIHTVKKLSGFTEKELLELHGLGKTSIPKLKLILKAAKLDFKKEKHNHLITEPSKTAEVDGYMKKLKHPLLPVVTELRKIILAADKSVGEQIAWNVPSFFYTGPMKPFAPKEYKRFIVCFNFYQRDCIRLIFLTGAKLHDQTGLLQGDYADGRRLAFFRSMNEVKSREKDLKAAIRKWLNLLEK